MPERITADPLVPAPLLITPAPITFRDHAEAWFNRAAPKLKRSTRDAYAATKDGLLDVFGAHALAEMRRGVIRTGLDAIEEGRDLSPSSMSRHHAVLGRIFADAVQRDLIERNPMLELAPVAMKGVRPLVVPTAEQLDRIVATIRACRLTPERQMLFEILDGAALRIGETQALKPADYENATQRLRVCRTIYRGKLQVGEDREDIPKGNVERWVDVPDSLAAKLRGFLACRREADWLFPGRFGDQPITYAPLREEMVRIATAARMPGMTVHAFRHARISLWVAHGADLEWVRRQAGHHSIAYTIARYGRHMPMREQRVLRDLGDLPAGGTTAG